MDELNEKHGRGVTEGSGKPDHTAALTMIEVFASVGAARFDVTVTNAAGAKERFRRDAGLAELRRTLPGLLDAAASQRRNVIVRPHGPGVTFVQLDDLAAEQLSRLAPAVFLTLETSPGNFQAWAALAGIEDKDFARRLRKGSGADPTASGATRIAGSFNFKAKYAPAYPRVAIHQAWPGRMTTATELDGLGLVAAPEVVAETLDPARARSGAGKRRWPSYARCLAGAPLNSEATGPDTSRADFVWCMTALTWGWTPGETAERLMAESEKARSNGRAYAELTTRNAALAMQRRRQPK